jgi:hypothetical protein
MDPFSVRPPSTKGSTKLNSLLIISHRLTGKTEALLQLPNALLIDFENHASAYASKANVFTPKEALKARNEKALKEGKSPQEQKPIGMVTFLRQFAQHLKDSRQHFDFIIIDTLTAVEQIAMPLAVVLFKNTKEGDSYTGSNVVTDLGYGKGQMFLRSAVEQILKPFEDLAGQCIIYTGHINSKVAISNDKEIEITDLDLTSQVKKIFTGNTSATGLLYRDFSGARNYITFVNKGDSLVVGARPDHLSNKAFVFSEKLNEQGEVDMGGTLKTYWENIFPDYFANLKKSKS